MFINGTTTGISGFRGGTGKPALGKKGKNDIDAEVRRNAERLLLRLDFNSAFTAPGRTGRGRGERGILEEGGLA